MEVETFSWRSKTDSQCEVVLVSRKDTASKPCYLEIKGHTSFARLHHSTELDWKTGLLTGFDYEGEGSMDLLMGSAFSVLCH